MVLWGWGADVERDGERRLSIAVAHCGRLAHNGARALPLRGICVEKDSRILVTGGRGLVGSCLVAHLRDAGYSSVIAPTPEELNLADRPSVAALFSLLKPQYVFHLAGYVHGIVGNMLNQAEAYLQNTLINTNVVEHCRIAGVEKVVAMGTIAMYPDPPPRNPLREEDVWQGSPYPAEYGYAHAKRGMLAHLEACNRSFGMNYALAFSTNLFGPNDRFNKETGHVIPSLVRKFHEARTGGGFVDVWGDGSQQRDFLYVKDAVRGLLLMMERLAGPVNLASGTDRTIREVAGVLEGITGLHGRVRWDVSRPTGQGPRSYDVTRLKNAAFTCEHDFAAALSETYSWYAENWRAARS